MKIKKKEARGRSEKALEFPLGWFDFFFFFAPICFLYEVDKNG